MLYLKAQVVNKMEVPGGIRKDGTAYESSRRLQVQGKEDFHGVEKLRLVDLTLPKSDTLADYQENSFYLFPVRQYKSSFFMTGSGRPLDS